MSDEQARIEAEQEQAQARLWKEAKRHGKDSAVGVRLLEQLFQMREHMVTGTLVGFAETLKGFRKRLDGACPLRAPMRKWGITGAVSLLIAIGLCIAGSVRQSVVQDSAITATVASISRCSTVVVGVKVQVRENEKTIVSLHENLAILIALGQRAALSAGVPASVVDSLSRPVPELVPPDTVGSLPDSARAGPQGSHDLLARSWTEPRQP